MARGRPRKADVTRTPSGQISRAKTGGLYSVYIAYFPTLGMLKVGRTGDVKNRARALETEIGRKPVICAEYRHGSLADASACEAEAIEYLKGLCAQKRGKEWFSVAAEKLPALVAGFYPKSVRALDRRILGQHWNSAPVGTGVRKQLFGHVINEARM